MKTVKEQIYRSPPTKLFSKGARWIYIERTSPDSWLMARVKDGHWVYIDPADLVLEGPNPPVPALSIPPPGPLIQYRYDPKERRCLRYIVNP